MIYRHKEKTFDDYQLQETLPHQFSQSGPSMAVGDIDGNGLDDLLLALQAAKALSYFINF
ncbi:MAG: hypothetical protein HC819_16450 [Cyclobacteriaceae bacterium]|nr:hypothetical protein [Cyclobacteriaceae bacterium]